MNEELLQQIKEQFPLLSDDRILHEIVLFCREFSEAEGSMLLEPGDEVDQIPLVFTGSIDVYKSDKQGIEQFYYQIGQGKTCVLTLLDGLRRKKCDVRLVVKENALVRYVSLEMVNRWMLQYPCWRDFVYFSFKQAMEDLHLACLT